MITYQMLVDHSLMLASKLPPNIAGVIGISRKGMIPASIIASRLHLPLAEVETFLAGKTLGHGKRVPLYSVEGGPWVIVDDGTSQSSASMLYTKDRLQEAFPDKQFLTAAVYVADKDHVNVDYYTGLCDPRCIQEPEFLNMFSNPAFAVDFDGVISVDPTQGETDDEELWTNIFRNAKPLYLPRLSPVGAIITSRMEKYRAVSEEWLRTWGCQYNQLVMCPATSVRERESMPVNYGLWKGQLFKESDLSVFVESRLCEALQIFQISGKPVICTENKKIILR